MQQRTRWIGWSIALAASLGVVAAALLPPFVDEPVRSTLMRAFAGVCHQLPERSLHVDGVSLAVCDRCMGIYGGVLVGVLVMPFVPHWTDRLHRYAGPVLVAALVPLTVDWLGPVVGMWSNVPLSRAVTGGLFGIAAGGLVARSAMHFRRRASDPAAALDDGTPRPNP